MRTISAATKTMLSAMTASTGRCGTCTKPSVAAESVMLCEIVKAVTVFTSLQPPRVMMSSASTNSRWSMPVRMCSTPSTMYVRATSSARGAASTTNDGADGVSRVTCVVPSRRSRRTSTSVIVAVRPAM